MNKKAIQILVIVLAFAASGIVLYRGLFKKKPVPPPPGSLSVPGAVSSSVAGTPGVTGAGAMMPVSGAVGSVSEILPYGTRLDFDRILKQYEFQFGAFEYPHVDPEAEVGISSNALIQPLPNETMGQ